VSVDTYLIVGNLMILIILVKIDHVMIVWNLHQIKVVEII